MRALRRLSRLATNLLVAAGAAAEIRPSFSLEHCSWEAAAVVVVSEGEEIDGSVVVLESWYGALAEGERIEVPRLAYFAPEERREVVRRWIPAPDAHATRVTGKRMVLFLAAGDAPSRWSPVESFPPGDELTVSHAWIEDGQVYACEQLVNPGPSELMALGMSEREMRRTVEAIASARDRLEAMLQGGEPDVVSSAVRTLFDDSTPLVRHRILQLLGDHGVNGAAAARVILRDESYLDHHHDAVRALAKAAGPEATGDFLEVLERELRFWKTAAPILHDGWWNAEGMSSHRSHYGRAVAALAALTGSDRADVATVVTAFRELWRSVPRLGDNGGNDQIARMCDSVLDR